MVWTGDSKGVEIPKRLKKNMRSNAKSVDEYLEEIPETRISAIKKLRQMCVEYLPDHEECMVYNMPSYKRNNQVEVAFASQKQHICVYILKHDVMLNNKEELKGINHGKGCIRFSGPTKIDFPLIAKLLQETIDSDSSIC